MEITKLRKCGLPSPPPIQPPFANPFRHSGNEPGVGGLALLQGLPNGGGRRRMRAGHPMQHQARPRLRWLAIPGQYHEHHTRRQPLRVSPARQHPPLVATHDPEQPGGGPGRPHRFRRFVGKRLALPADFEIIHHRPRQIRRGQPQHRQPVGRRRRLGPGLVRRHLAREKPHLVERQRRLGQARQVQMPPVDRIERAAEQRDFPGFSHDVSRVRGKRRAACPPSPETAG
jgi:hypothetical protein